MKHVLIFTLLYPPLVLTGILAADPEWHTKSLDLSLLAWMLGAAYLLGLVPALWSAVVDCRFSAKPNYLRVLGAMAVAAGVLMTELVALHFGAILTGWITFVFVALIGGIPAAACSWLSRFIQASPPVFR
jgi:uncharacterized protein YjeT (DUF2065 family)